MGVKHVKYPLQFKLFIQKAQNFQDFGNPGKKKYEGKNIFSRISKILEILNKTVKKRHLEMSDERYYDFIWKSIPKYTLLQKMRYIR